MFNVSTRNQVSPVNPLMGTLKLQSNLLCNFSVPIKGLTELTWLRVDTLNINQIMLVAIH